MLGEPCYNAIFGSSTVCDNCPVKGLNDNNNRYSVEAYQQTNEAWYSSTASMVELPDSQRINIISATDVTDFMERMNSRDTLTGLLTFSKFESEVMRMIAGQPDAQYVILYCDIDKFKNINDEWGYSIGNELLKYYASKVNDFISSTEILCRITADKFILLLNYKNKNQLLERVYKTYLKINNDFRIKYPKINPVFVSGVYFLTQEDKVISVAIDKANLARKTIKGGHKSNIAVYDESFHKKVTSEKMIENNMFEALKNNEFFVCMQPKIDLQTSKIIGAEALVRWKLPSGQVMGPMEFIPIFERNGFIDELDFYVYDITFRSLRQWLEKGNEPFIVSINVSRIHIKDSKFLERLDKLVEKYKIPTSCIELEITESMFFNELDRLLWIMNSLRKRGFLISIDDFGSGYSSLNLLKTLPIDIIKLDREFFMKNRMQDNDKIVISGIISLAKGLGLKVISEGVETLEQAEFLKESSCDMAQGFLFYQPLPMEDFYQLMSSSKSNEYFMN
jgi:diguanylate cyclase (GGDEF)-like protein